MTQRIRALLARQPHVIVALDGRCCAGKTTLAAALEQELGAAVIHMDDFFLRPEQRTKERLAEVGGNVDYERFQAEVLRPLCDMYAPDETKPLQPDNGGRSGLALSGGGPAGAARGGFTYRRFDCHSMAMGEVRRVPKAAVTIVEGCYSCHPIFGDYADLRCFLSVDPAEQERRVKRRNGESGWPAFRDRWIPKEEAYFRQFAVEARCNCRLTKEGHIL